MNDEKNILKNNKLLDKLFDYSNQQDDILYKNKIIPPLIDDKNNNEESEKNKIEITRDKILKNLSLEEYELFPPKNDSFIINTNEQGKEKEDNDKLLSEEIDYLQNLNKLNYLTFSPFGTSFFHDLNKNKNNREENDKNIKEKENKLLNIIDFDYNNYEINNDLLFNIGMGFIDINKLKLENVTTNEKNNKSLPKKKNEKYMHILDNYENDDTIKEISDNENVSEISESVELNISLLNELNHFIEKKKNISYFTEIINLYKKELNEVEKSNDINKENELLEKWKKKLHEKKENYLKYLIEEKKKERKLKEEEKIKKLKEIKLEKEKKQKIIKENEFLKELEKIRIKGIKKLNRKKEMSYLNNYYNINNPSSYRDRDKFRKISAEPFEENESKRIKTGRNGNKYWNKIFKSFDNSDRYSYIKKKNDYFFHDL